jgi:CheY-like chemotaxis protein
MSDDQKTANLPVNGSDSNLTVDTGADYIVVAEDSGPNRQILCLLLRKLGFATLEFEDGKAAWEALQNVGGRKIVAVISDLMMPTMDGLELLRRVRNDESMAKLPFVLVTAVSDKDYVFEAKNLEVDGYILKPVTYKRIADKMQALFPNRQFPPLAS